MQSELVVSQVPVLLKEEGIPVVYPPSEMARALPVEADEPVWAALYERLYRRVIRTWKKGRRVEWRAPAYARAALVADYVVWLTVPAEDRPADWPRTVGDLALRAGTGVIVLRALAFRLGAKQLVERSPFDLKAKVLELDAMLYSRAVEELSHAELGKNATRAVELWYKRAGALSQAGPTLNVQIGDRNKVVLGVPQPGDFEDRLKRLTEVSLQYLERAKGGSREVEGVVVPGEDDEVSRGTDHRFAEAGESTGGGDCRAS